MAGLEAEQNDSTLWLSGNIVPSMEEELNRALNTFFGRTNSPKPVIDMSNVRYIASSSAKAIIAAAQDVHAKGTRALVKASIPVQRTLDILGAKSWVELEQCRIANPKPTPTQTQTGLRGQTGVLPKVAPPDSGGSVGAYKATVHIKPSESASRLPAARPAAEQALQEPTAAELGAAVPPTPVPGQTNLNITPAVPKGATAGPLLPPGAEIPADLEILRRLTTTNIYTFHFVGGECTGRILEYMGGAWVLIDVRNTRKMVNLRMLTYLDVMA